MISTASESWIDGKVLTWAYVAMFLRKNRVLISIATYILALELGVRPLPRAS